MATALSATTTPTASAPLKPLRGVRVLSLALNLPGPGALMRLRAMGATCTKAEPPAPKGMPAGTPGDPMGQYNPKAYATLHAGIKVISVDLKTDKGQAALHKALATTDVLLSSFRPSALAKLGLGWKALHKRHPALSHVAIVGAPGERAEEPGHDLTYLADNGLVTGLDLPPTLFADMGGALMASEAVLQAVLAQRLGKTGRGRYLRSRPVRGRRLAGPAAPLGPDPAHGRGRRRARRLQGLPLQGRPRRRGRAGAALRRRPVRRRRCAHAQPADPVCARHPRGDCRLPAHADLPAARPAGSRERHSAAHAGE